MKLMRIQEMEEYILKHGATSLDELCEVFNVSKNTVRRDINKLAEKGVIKKVYGGVTSAEKSVLVLLKTAPFSIRMKKSKSPAMRHDLSRITILCLLIPARRPNRCWRRLIPIRM